VTKRRNCPEVTNNAEIAKGSSISIDIYVRIVGSNMT